MPWRGCGPEIEAFQEEAEHLLGLMIIPVLLVFPHERGQ